jgi:hypothetical protein
MTSAYLKGVQTAHPHAWPCSYLGVRLRPPCSDVGKSQAGTVDDVVANPQPPVLLSSSQGHDYVCINVMLTRVVIFPILVLTGLYCMPPARRSRCRTHRTSPWPCVPCTRHRSPSIPGQDVPFAAKKSKTKISVMKQV